MQTRFLIVDDSALVRQGLSRVLRAHPQWEICGEAADGTTAVELFRNLLPHIVILDFQMPGMNGLEAARRMLEIAPAVPILMLTQHASTNLEEHAQRVGIRSVVPKTDVFSLVHMIEEFLSRGDFETDAEGPLNNGHRPIEQS